MKESSEKSGLMAMCLYNAFIIQNVLPSEIVIIGSIGHNVMIAQEDIPTDIDILVTHYPPYGILDEGMGSTEILNFVLHSQPKYHLFGHIHSTAGQKHIFGNTTCVNIATIL